MSRRKRYRYTHKKPVVIPQLSPAIPKPAPLPKPAGDSGWRKIKTRGLKLITSLFRAVRFATSHAISRFLLPLIQRIRYDGFPTIISLSQKTFSSVIKYTKIIFPWLFKTLGKALQRIPRVQFKKRSYFPNKKYIVGALALVLIAFWYFILRDIPSPTKLGRYEIPLATKIYDRHGTLLFEIFAEQNRTIVKLDQVPDHLKEATIAIEDKDFYLHPGFNPVGGILRAVKSSVEKRRLEGGSTITQQLIKSALLSPERTIQRKTKEIILAVWAELIYSKDQILELYLNQVPYGGTAWGIDAASRKYFGKAPKDLTLSESALLAGLPQAPTQFSPFGAYPELAVARQHQVLNRMVEDKYISKEQADAAMHEELKYASPSSNIKAPHFVLYVKDLLVQKYGEKIVEQGGLKVTTTLDYALQEEAEKIVAGEIGKLEKLKVGNGAAVITRPPTGEILAMVGSHNYFKEGWGNVNVTIRHRQPGSSIKPINYAIGLENRKITAASVFWDVPTCFNVAGQKPYCPKNYDSAFHGPVQTRFALGNSYNIPAVKMLALNTLPTMVASASAFGLDTLQDPSKYGLSLTLGGGEVTMLDMAEAFSVFANTGKRKDVQAILKVEDKNGEVLEEFTDPNFSLDVESQLSQPASILINGPQVVSAETAFIMSHILLDNNARMGAFGASSALVIPGKPAVSVKTGTTNDLRDNWTIGFTPNFLVATWVGNNDNTPMSAIASGVSGASPIWNKIMRRALEKQSDLWPRQPGGIVGKFICMPSGKIPPADGACPNGRYEYFIKGTEPGIENLAKQQIFIDKGTGAQAKEGQTENVEQQEKSMLTDVYGQTYCMDCAIASQSAEQTDGSR